MSHGYSDYQMMKAQAQFQLAADLLAASRGADDDDQQKELIGKALTEADDAYDAIGLSGPSE